MATRPQAAGQNVTLVAKVNGYAPNGVVTFTELAGLGQLGDRLDLLLPLGSGPALGACGGGLAALAEQLFQQK